MTSTEQASRCVALARRLATLHEPMTVNQIVTAAQAALDETDDELGLYAATPLMPDRAGVLLGIAKDFADIDAPRVRLGEEDYWLLTLRTVATWLAGHAHAVIEHDESKPRGLCVCGWESHDESWEGAAMVVGQHVRESRRQFVVEVLTAWLPVPRCRLGYPPPQLARIFDDRRYLRLTSWMAQRGLDSQLCTGEGCGPHGSAISEKTVRDYVARDADDA